MSFFAQADKVFHGKQTARQGEDDVDRDETPKLQPCQCRTVDAEPQCLTDNDLRLSRRLGWEAPVEEVYDGKDRARHRHDGKDEETPARYEVGKCLCNEEIQSAPASDEQDEGGKPKGFEGELRFVHWVDYTLGGRQGRE